MRTRTERPLPQLPHPPSQHIVHPQRHPRRVRRQIKGDHYSRIERIGIAIAEPILCWSDYRRRLHGRRLLAQQTFEHMHPTQLWI